MINAVPEIIYIPDLNYLYSSEIDADTGCLNTRAIQRFSLSLNEAVKTVLNENQFAIVLGGDCSILIGIMSALKGSGKTGLVFIDAHADFYSPETSVTGEVADMDLAIVSGRGPAVLTDINQSRPYVADINQSRPYVDDENIIHIGQRDEDEASAYQSPDIRKTKINCIPATEVTKQGAFNIATIVSEKINGSLTDHCWVHFDTDVLDDEINPAVDYRLPGGLKIDEVQTIIKAALSTGRCRGISVTIFNPLLDKDGTVCNKLVSCIAEIL